MADTELQYVWSQLHPGLRVRWTTPSFIRRGTIQSIKGTSMVVLFDGFARPTPIPQAKEYFVDWVTGRKDYQLCPIEGKGPEPVLDTLTGMYAGGGSEFISVQDAANILGTDAKNVRRKLRAGTLRGRQEAIGGRWEVLRESLPPT